MTLVKQRALALVVTLVLVAGCAFAFAASQGQAFAEEMNLTAGTTEATATQLPINNKTFSSSNKTAFNTRADNNYYKFITSNRDSRYKITLLSYDGSTASGDRYTIYGTLYDSGKHRVANFSTKKTRGQSWIFKNLQRNALYYIEVWRYTTDPSGDGYLASGNAQVGQLENVYPPYKITLKEQIVKPTLLSYNAASKKEHELNLTWGEPSYNADKVQIEFWWSWEDNKTINNTFYRTAKASSKGYSTEVKQFGSAHRYKVRIRPYLVANGERVYGKWMYCNAGGKKSGYGKTSNATNGKGLIIRPGSIKNFKAKSDSKGYLNLTWKPLVTKKDSIQVQMQRDSWGGNKDFYFTAKATSAVFNHNTLHPGQKYRVRIRAIHPMDGGKFYGNWTAWKKVTIKSK